MPTAKITNVEFARRVGCDHTTASRYRSGERAPSTRMLFKILSAFGEEVSDAQQLALTKAIAKTTTLDQRRKAISAWLRKNVFALPSRNA